MLGQETSGIPFVQAERPPTASEIALWDKAMKLARRTNLISYAVKLQWAQIKLTHSFAQKKQVALGEPDLPDLADRMFAALKEIESLKDLMCRVNQLELGIRLSADGKDLDIVQPEETGELSFGQGWILPAILGVALVVGIIARWAFLEREVSEISAKYNGVINRADNALCKDPDSEMCHDWENSKKSGGYYKRETIIDSVKNALVSAGSTAKKGLGVGLALLLPLLALMYLPRRKS
jgi:hypothetical protein